MRIAVAREADPSEDRVAATPETVKKMKGLGAEVVVEPGAGLRSGFSDADYAAAGASVARDDAWDEMIALAEKHRARVWASPNSGRNSFPENHPLFAGFLAADREKIVASLRDHDLILVLGAPVFTYHVEGFGPHIPDGARLFQLVDDPAVAAWAPAGTAAVASLKSGIRDLLDRVRR